MKKKILLRSLLGIPLGICLGYLITIFISFLWADGHYSPCVPELTLRLGNELYAVVLQTLLCGVLGASFGASSVIWEIEHWGLVKQTGIYFLVISVIMMPIAYITYWMEHSLAGILRYFGIFVFIFIIIWIVQYTIAWHTVKKMNETLPK
ncbi:MAG: DUF3021 domain-containing protein [Lachnospiraceae bacterium]|jgi:hypothetical protein|nr:DUF3021 domain-containing protein [Lachnospiraceae bacterium]